MQDFFATDQSNWIVAAVTVAVLLLAWLIYRRGVRGNRLQRVLDEISYDRVDGVLIPNGDEGEIQIDHLLLTARGLIIVDIKDVSGTVFGRDPRLDGKCRRSPVWRMAQSSSSGSRREKRQHRRLFFAWAETGRRK